VPDDLFTFHHPSFQEYPMTIRILRFLLPITALLMWIGCSGAQKAVDTHFIKKTVGQKYSDLMSREGFKLRVDYGELAVTEKLADNSTFYLHVEEYESGSTTWLGVWGKVKYSYKLNAFKVKDDIVQDWAYGLYTPEERAKHVFGFEFGYKHEAILERVKSEYPNLIKTSTDEKIVAWKR
jgi:hypothetical protein